MTPGSRCQCPRFPDAPCETRMTQEDLLCDTCRGGCSGAQPGYLLPGLQHFGIRYFRGFGFFRWGNG